MTKIYVFLTLIFGPSLLLCQDYIVNTEECKIPNLEPFSQDALGYFANEDYIPCTRRQLLTYITKQENKAYLHVKEHLFPVYGGYVTCCYSKVERNATGSYPDDQISVGQCKPFSNSTVLDEAEDTILVDCRDRFNVTIYKNVHSPIVIKKDVQQKIKNIKANSKPISVLFVVVDSVSRLNLIRTMPKTRDYLLENNFVEMKAYNKINDNTFPNFMALLTGYDPRIERKCQGTRIGELNKCPLVWYEFQKLGYATAYGEDFGPLGTFNYLKKGFSEAPTDYYFRHYVLASETISTLYHKGGIYCAGPESAGERQLNLARDFAVTFKNLPYFGIFWMNAFSHQGLNTPMGFDDKLKYFFTDLKAEGVLNDSIIIFLSDHGMRMDYGIRRTKAGWFEERLPLNLMSVPEWFQKKHPLEYQNLKENAQKLTSTFDLYLTLEHILDLSGIKHNLNGSIGCQNCLSLFKNISTDRGCYEAGIPKEWCSCIGKLTTINPSAPLAIQGAEYALQHMRQKLRVYNVYSLCEPYTLDHIGSASITPVSTIAQDNFLLVNFETKPKSEFVVLLNYEEVAFNKFAFDIIGSILRLNYYFRTICVRHVPKASDYCNCKVSNATSTSTLPSFSTPSTDISKN